MEIKKPAVAGTLESSDAQVSIEPNASGIEFSLESSVIDQYGRQIRSVVLKTLQDLGVQNASVRVVDKGALDCTIKARVECAVHRAAEKNQNFAWGGEIR
ncbi:MAG: citrate lyase acyl carrier protein [Peptostreptococcaceae bacterium]|nr:citrate lyase acyl carrier protein [Peptostreptococcaceae bacterium]